MLRGGETMWQQTCTLVSDHWKWLNMDGFATTFSPEICNFYCFIVKVWSDLPCFCSFCRKLFTSASVYAAVCCHRPPSTVPQEERAPRPCSKRPWCFNADDPSFVLPPKTSKWAPSSWLLCPKWAQHLQDLFGRNFLFCLIYFALLLFQKFQYDTWKVSALHVLKGFALFLFQGVTSRITWIQCYSIPSWLVNLSITLPIWKRKSNDLDL